MVVLASLMAGEVSGFPIIANTNTYKIGIDGMEKIGTILNSYTFL